MGRPQKFKPEQVAKALRDNRGMVYLAAEMLGCSADTVQNYINRYPMVAAERKHQDGIITDMAEVELMKAIKRGERWAIMFRLARKGKDRDYSERQEVTGDDGGAIHVVIKYADA